MPTQKRPSHHVNNTSTIVAPDASETTPTSPAPSSSGLNARTPSSIRVRSRTSTISYTPPLPPVMSRENSLEDVPSHFAGPSSLPGPSTLLSPTAPTKGRKASKSVSNVRPNLLLSTKRTQSYHHASASANTAPIPSLLESPTHTTNPRLGLKRRISTPSMVNRQPPADDPDRLAVSVEAANEGKKKAETRARSTSTSLVVPEAGPSRLSAPHTTPLPFRATVTQPTPPSPWAPIFVTPASPEYHDVAESSSKHRSNGILTSAYNIGESSVLKLASLVRPNHHTPLHRRDSDDSEKGLETEEDYSTVETRTSEDSLRRNGRYWGIHEDDDADGGYFSLPPTPPEERSTVNDFEEALKKANGDLSSTLPTPALSTRSLSRNGSRKRKTRVESEATGWLATVYRVWANLGTGSRTGKTGEVMRELGWTVGLLVGLFFVTAASALWMIQAMPITQLKHIPQSTTDLQLLSAEIRAYMASSDAGFWHTVGVLTFVGCWKHAWSVPGAVVLNILVGSVLEPMPALALLTIITASGSLFSYLLSRPLAPLIAVLFPKPLALVRAALAPNSAPTSASATTHTDEKVTAIQVSPTSPPVTGDTSSVWRRLLIMRAMGFVPWSGMNVACGVVGVDWKVFWLTTAAGSASWSYVTASVGNILSRLAIPTSALEAGDDMVQGESLTSLLRDPVLIAKLVFLSLLTLLPVVLKRRNQNASPESSETTIASDGSAHGISLLPSESPTSAISPSSPLTRSLARFTPTPAVFDLLSFGRTALRTGGKVVVGGVRGTVNAAQRVAGGR